MQRWRTARAILAATISLSFATASRAQDWHDDGPPPVIQRLPPIDIESPLASEVIESSESWEPTPPPKRAAPGLGPLGGTQSPYKSEIYWIPNQDVKGQRGHWSQSAEMKNVAFPIYAAPEGGNIWLATASVARTEISTSAILPDSNMEVPAELWKINAGAMHFRELDNGWKTGAILTIGTASDKPFDAFRDLTATAIAFATVPAANERDNWNFSLFYSPTSQIPFPIPGIAYAWRPSEELTANIGVPFSLQYCPTETFSFSASYMPLTNVNLLAKQKLTENWNLYGGYQVVNDIYWLAERTDDQERFYLFDQRLTLGLQRKLFWGFTADLSAGYIFDRQAFQANSFSSHHHDEILIDPGLIGTLQLFWTH